MHDATQSAGGTVIYSLLNNICVYFVQSFIVVVDMQPSGHASPPLQGPTRRPRPSFRPPSICPYCQCSASFH